jgi:hypothetical protein
MGGIMHFSMRTAMLYANSHALNVFTALFELNFRRFASFLPFYFYEVDIQEKSIITKLSAMLLEK